MEPLGLSDIPAHHLTELQRGKLGAVARPTRLRCALAHARGVIKDGRRVHAAIVVVFLLPHDRAGAIPRIVTAVPTTALPSGSPSVPTPLTSVMPASHDQKNHQQEGCLKDERKIGSHGFSCSSSASEHKYCIWSS